jgi:hypothetical protein
LPLYPTEILAERFLQQDLERYSRDLSKFLQDPKYFDEESRESLEEFWAIYRTTRTQVSGVTAGNVCGFLSTLSKKLLPISRWTLSQTQAHG